MARQDDNVLVKFIIGLLDIVLFWFLWSYCGYGGYFFDEYLPEKWTSLTLGEIFALVIMVVFIRRKVYR